jgi:hypothetical protein
MRKKGRVISSNHQAHTGRKQSSQGHQYSYSLHQIVCFVQEAEEETLLFHVNLNEIHKTKQSKAKTKLLSFIRSNIIS